jgi:very-short-patch-repair endonuclease
MTNYQKYGNPNLFHQQVVAPGDLQMYGYRPRKSRKMHYRGRSPIEDRLADILDEIGLEYKMNLYLGKYEVDFLLEDLKLVIEANGKSFHNEKKDSIKANYLFSLGYRVIQIRGSDIINQPNKVIMKIKLKIKSIGRNINS